MATILLPPDFKEFLQLLNDHQVEYLLIGGYAVGYHGYPRATGDMDIWVAVNPSNAANIVAALNDFGFGNTNLTPDLLLEEQKIIRMGNPPLRIELLTSVSGVDFATCYGRRIIETIDGITVPIIALDDLKTNKQASARRKDLNDLDNLP
jgi:predicted nucleotidyltransferase